MDIESIFNKTSNYRRELDKEIDQLRQIKSNYEAIEQFEKEKASLIAELGHLLK